MGLTTWLLCCHVIISVSQPRDLENRSILFAYTLNIIFVFYSKDKEIRSSNIAFLVLKYPSHNYSTMSHPFLDKIRMNKDQKHKVLHLSPSSGREFPLGAVFAWVSIEVAVYYSLSQFLAICLIRQSHSLPFD